MALQMETVERCCICGTDLSLCTSRVNVKDAFGISDETFRYVECAGCGTWVQTPRPVETELGQFYEGDFIPDKAAMGSSLLGRLALRAREIQVYLANVRWILNYLEDGQAYLDYSTGDGEVLAMVSKARPSAEAYATEFSPTYRKLLTQRLPEVTVKKDLGDFKRGLRFDVISALAVMEHVYDPVAMLKALHERLNPGGILIVDLPNVDTYQRYLTGGRWWTWVAPRHMNLMRYDSTIDLLARCGFDVIEEGHFHLRNGPLSLVLSLFPGVNPIRTTKLKLALYGLLSLGAIPVEYAAALLKKSTFMTLVAKKKLGT